MAAILVSIDIAAPPEVVWDDVRHIDRHVEWMNDAEKITFTSKARSGVGTAFDCLTKVGPLRMTDRMEITDWDEEQRMGVRHVGLVTGEGQFTLTPAADGGTRFTWDERLTFPWWMGGPVGGVVGGIILTRIWRKNLALLAARFD